MTNLTNFTPANTPHGPQAPAQYKKERWHIPKITPLPPPQPQPGLTWTLWSLNIRLGARHTQSGRAGPGGASWRPGLATLITPRQDDESCRHPASADRVPMWLLFPLHDIGHDHNNEWWKFFHDKNSLLRLRAMVNMEANVTAKFIHHSSSIQHQHA